ncbi:hypothetical protein ABN034_31415 [Actinopolymorpha sp. B11F2]|uniref:hypothetical protein n=1 Tax=Actinopolymorpha sp. B11F2 TaxID=3160862 RepID=UPI0032E4830C
MGLDQPAATRKPVPDEETIKFMADFSARAMTWASNNVIKEWAAWKAMAAQEDDGDQSLRLVFQFEKIMLAMRTDLGHEADELKSHELLRNVH